MKQADILSVLDDWKSAVQIVNELDKQFKPFSVQAIYPTLVSMEKQGLIVSRQETPEEQAQRIARDGRDDRGGMKKTLYKKTDAGNRWLDERQLQIEILIPGF